MSTTTHRGTGDPRRASKLRRKQERQFARRHHAQQVQRMAEALHIHDTTCIVHAEAGRRWCTTTKRYLP